MQCKSSNLSSSLMGIEIKCCLQEQCIYLFKKHPEALLRLKWSSFWQQLTVFTLYVRCSEGFGCIFAFYYSL